MRPGRKYTTDGKTLDEEVAVEEVIKAILITQKHPNVYIIDIYNLKYYRTG